MDDGELAGLDRYQRLEHNGIGIYVNPDYPDWDFLGHRLKLRVERDKDTVYLSPIFKWFGKDFVSTHTPVRNIGRQDRETSAVLHFVAGYLDETDMRNVRAGSFKVKYLDYDWSLNEQRD